MFVVDEHHGACKLDRTMVQKLWIVFDVVDPKVGRREVGAEKNHVSLNLKLVKDELEVEN